MGKIKWCKFMTTANNYIKETIENEYNKSKDENYNYKQLYSNKLIDYRAQKGSVIRIPKPTNIPRARELGYKAKQGFVIVFVKVRKGSGLIKKPNMGRRPKRVGVNKITRRISIQRIAEQRAGKQFPNLEVLNSYYVGEDGQKKYYEVILVDPYNPSILSDKDINWIFSSAHKKRVERGLTSAGKKNRGLNNKGRGAEKIRPSLRANSRKAR